MLTVAATAEAVTTAGDVVQRIEGVDVVILGEVHDNPAHHVFQTDVVAALDPAAIVFEMVTAEEARFVTPDLAADAEALSEALGWAESGWPDFALYYPLFRQAARARRLWRRGASPMSRAPPLQKVPLPYFPATRPGSA